MTQGITEENFSLTPRELVSVHMRTRSPGILHDLGKVVRTAIGPFLALDAQTGELSSFCMLTVDCHIKLFFISDIG